MVVTRNIQMYEMMSGTFFYGFIYLRKNFSRRTALNFLVLTY